MPTHRSRFVAPALALLTLLALGACSSDSKSATSTSSSSSSSSSNGDKAKFCKDNADLDAATSNVSGPQELAQAFKDNTATLDDILVQAPAEVKAETALLVDAAKKVAATGDISPFENNTELQTAGQKLNTFCGATASTGSSRSSASSESTSS